jgi:hypothetical protein
MLLPSEQSWLKLSNQASCTYQPGQIPALGSGLWAGDYTEGGGPVAQAARLFPMSMTVHATQSLARVGNHGAKAMVMVSRLEGTGRDTVGSFGVVGAYSGATGQCSFAKKYVRGTENPRDNRGQTVEYRGSVQPHGAGGVIAGRWYMLELGSTTTVICTGHFRLELPTVMLPAAPQYTVQQANVVVNPQPATSSKTPLLSAAPPKY